MIPIRPIPNRDGAGYSNPHTGKRMTPEEVAAWNDGQKPSPREKIPAWVRIAVHPAWARFLLIFMLGAFASTRHLVFLALAFDFALLFVVAVWIRSLLKEHP